MQLCMIQEFLYKNVQAGWQAGVVQGRVRRQRMDPLLVWALVLSLRNFALYLQILRLLSSSTHLPQLLLLLALLHLATIPPLEQPLEEVTFQRLWSGLVVVLP